jgi:hypothetical protein
MIRRRPIAFPKLTGEVCAHHAREMNPVSQERQCLIHNGFTLLDGAGLLHLRLDELSVLFDERSGGLEVAAPDGV